MMHEVSADARPRGNLHCDGDIHRPLFFGPHPSFVIPEMEQPYFHVSSPGARRVLCRWGILVGLLSAAFIRSIYAFEDFFTQKGERRILRAAHGWHARRRSDHVRPHGLLRALLHRGSRLRDGSGHSFGHGIEPGSLLLLLALKLLATSLTLGSGASGGIFSPALFLGATLGGAYGVLLQRLFPGMAISPPAFAVAGMAGMVGGSTGAAWRRSS